jgi:hypothetical protein
MRLVQTRHISGLFWVERYRLLRTVPVGIVAGIPLMDQPMDPLLLEPLHHFIVDVFI